MRPVWQAGVRHRGDCCEGQRKRCEDLGRRCAWQRGDSSAFIRAGARDPLWGGTDKFPQSKIIDAENNPRKFGPKVGTVPHAQYEARLIERPEQKPPLAPPLALIVSPMFSLQGDWQRKLLIAALTGSLETDLSGDAGWWRGRSLYRQSSGVYVLHEGQAGCVVFRVPPPALMRQAEISCDKTDQTTDDDWVQVGNAPAGFPASKFSSDFQYIGTFVEIPQGQDAISFFGADEQAEAELPDIMQAAASSRMADGTSEDSPDRRSPK